MRQALLFDRQNAEPAIPVRVPPPAQARLSAQCQRILERLRLGPATNGELALLALKYTGRLSDLRAAGHTIDCVKHDHQTGVAVYVLRGGA